MQAIRIVTTVFIAIMMIIVGGVTLKPKNDAQTVVVAGVMELIYIMALFCMWG